MMLQSYYYENKLFLYRRQQDHEPGAFSAVALDAVLDPYPATIDVDECFHHV